MTLAQISPVLEIENLTISLPVGADRSHAVSGIGLAIDAGQTLCIIGESGSGKSMCAHAVMGLLPKVAVPTSGSIKLMGRDVVHLGEDEFRAIRGRDVGMIFQEPMTSLNPVMRVSDQIMEVFEAHRALGRAERLRRVIDLLDEVGLPEPTRIARSFPHQLSGGQRQRVMIAIALAMEPKLLIADEPTTALDVTTQAQILRLIDRLRRRHGTAVLFITHDFGVVAQIADRIAVLQNGLLVEQGTAEAVLGDPKADYTKKLLEAVPSMVPRPPRTVKDFPAVLKVEGLRKTYSKSSLFSKGRVVSAADNVSFKIARGETLGLVGESGSGKSTVGRCCLKLIEPDGGRVEIDNIEVSSMTPRMFRPYRRRIQMVFQDPFASLNPRQTVGQIVAAGPIAQGNSKADAWQKARNILAMVGLSETAQNRYPHEFSGGQRQRIGLARALAVEPDILIADEAVSALDVSVQAQILALIEDVQRRLGLAVLFVTHDLRVAAQICDRVAVMQRGRIVEIGRTADVFANPSHEYTKQLLSAVPGARSRTDHQKEDDSCL